MRSSVPRAAAVAVAAALMALASGCGGAHATAPGGSGGSAVPDGTGGDDAAPDGTLADAGAADAAAPAAACTTHITYGDLWIHGANHPAQDDTAAGAVTWDGVCHDDGTNSYAVLSNGWKPYFAGHGGCLLALDQSGCAGAPAACATRATYGDAWIHGPGHPSQYDDVAGRLTWDRACTDSGSDSYATLSNGWQPHFSGSGACAIALSYTQCGGLYDNPVVPEGCADPGVLRDGDRYVLVCTSGNAANAFSIRVSRDLVHWSAMGAVFPSGSKPSWAKSDFWAPEIHKVGARYVAYFTARGSDGMLAIGAASSASATGPFTDLGHPLVHDAAMGLIDASEFEAPDGSRYLLWKEDGNAVGKPTPIHAQPLAADGLSLTGAPSTLITNDQAWEGALVEGPWMVAHGGSYYLFYSGNSYASARYAIGVARAASPLGPFTKAAAPIVTSNATWVGPGHCSVVDGPGGDSYVVYHAWLAGHVAGPGDQRLGLVDRLVWGADGWPALPGGPSASSRPMP